MSDTKEKLARQIAKHMNKDPDELIRLPGKPTEPLWVIIARTMDTLPPAVKSVRALASASERAANKMQRFVDTVLHHYPRWTKPSKVLPMRKTPAAVVSENVVIRISGETHMAYLLFGDPVGSHRWMLVDNEEIRHVLDIDDWRYLPR